MDLVNCQVKLRGEPYHTVSKVEVSVPEVALLRHIHGNDAVVNIRPVRHTRIDKLELRGRLEEQYGEKNVAALWGESNQTARNLPIKLEEIGISRDSAFMDPSARQEKKSRGKAASVTDVDDLEPEEGDYEEDEDLEALEELEEEEVE